MTPHSSTCERGVGSKIQIRLVRDIGPLESDWNRIFSDCASASIFQSWQWADAWLTAYGQNDVFIIAGFEGDEPVGLLPLYLSSWPPGLSAKALRVLHLIADAPDDACGLGAVIKNGREAEFVSNTLDWLESKPGGWDVIELRSLSGNASNVALLDEVRRRGWATRTRTSPHSILDLNLTEITSISRDAKRAWSRLAPMHVKYERASSEVEVNTALEHLFRLHTQRWASRGMSGAFSIDGRKDFYRRIGHSMLHADALDLWTLKIDGEVVATEFGLVCGKTRYSLQSGFDPRFARQRVGALLDRHILESMRQRGLSRLDLLLGEEKYKKDMGSTTARLTHLRCAPPGSAGAAWVRASSITVLQRAWASVKRIVAAKKSRE